MTTSSPPLLTPLTPCSSHPIELHAQSGPTSLEWKPFLGKGKVQTGIRRSHVRESGNLEDSRGSFLGDFFWEGDWSIELQRFAGSRSCLHTVSRAKCGRSQEPSPVLGCASYRCSCFSASSSSCDPNNDSLTHQIGPWCSHYFGQLWVPFLG